MYKPCLSDQAGPFFIDMERYFLCLTILEYYNILMNMKNSVDERALQKTSRALKSIAHPARLRILMILGCAGKFSVSELQRALGISQSMTSQHLAAMRAQGVLTAAKVENKVFYSIGNKEVLKIIACMKNCAGR